MLVEEVVMHTGTLLTTWTLWVPVQVCRLTYLYLNLYRVK